MSNDTREGREGGKRKTMYRVTIQLMANLPLTSKVKFCFGLACPGLARPKWNFCFEVNGRFATSGMVTLYNYITRLTTFHKSGSSFRALGRVDDSEV